MLLAESVPAPRAPTIRTDAVINPTPTAHTLPQTSPDRDTPNPRQTGDPCALGICPTDCHATAYHCPKSRLESPLALYRQFFHPLDVQTLKLSLPQFCCLQSSESLRICPKTLATSAKSVKMYTDRQWRTIHEPPKTHRGPRNWRLRLACGVRVLTTTTAASIEADARELYSTTSRGYSTATKTCTRPMAGQSGSRKNIPPPS